MSTPQMPLRWAEFILERLLDSEDRQTVTGDLREEYAEVILPRLGRFEADLWYLRQVASFAPRCACERGYVRASLLLLSFFTLMCGCWLAGMEWLLRHPGYLSRVAMDVSIALVAVATILVRLLHLGIRVEKWLRAAAIALIGIGVRAFVHNARSGHFEGFVLVISLAVMLQGILMLLSFGRAAGCHRGDPGMDGLR